MTYENESLDIIEYIKKNKLSYKEVTYAVRSLGETNDQRAVPFLLDFFKHSNPWYLRDAVAISLGKLKANEAIPYIIDLIKLPANKNKRGSLIYSLINLDCIQYFPYFIEIIATANFECRQMAFFLVEKYSTKIGEQIRLLALSYLSQQKILIEVKKQDRGTYSQLRFIEETENLLSQY